MPTPPPPLGPDKTYIGCQFHSPANYTRTLHNLADGEVHVHDTAGDAPAIVSLCLTVRLEPSLHVVAANTVPVTDRYSSAYPADHRYRFMWAFSVPISGRYILEVAAVSDGSSFPAQPFFKQFEVVLGSQSRGIVGDFALPSTDR